MGRWVQVWLEMANGDWDGLACMYVAMSNDRSQQQLPPFSPRPSHLHLGTFHTPRPQCVPDPRGLG